MTHRTFDNPGSIEARQALLDRRVERRHPKRHRTRKRSAKLRLVRKKRAVHKIALDTKRRETFYALSRAYWAGERDEHP